MLDDDPQVSTSDDDLAVRRPDPSRTRRALRAARDGRRGQAHWRDHGDTGDSALTGAAALMTIAMAALMFYDQTERFGAAGLTVVACLLVGYLSVHRLRHPSTVIRAPFVVLLTVSVIAVALTGALSRGLLSVSAAGSSSPAPTSSVPTATPSSPTPSAPSTSPAPTLSPLSQAPSATPRQTSAAPPVPPTSTTSSARPWRATDALVTVTAPATGTILRACQVIAGTHRLPPNQTIVTTHRNLTRARTKQVPYWVEPRTDWRNPSKDGRWTSKQFFSGIGDDYEVAVIVIPLDALMEPTAHPDGEWGIPEIPGGWQVVWKQAFRRGDVPGTC